MRRIYQNSWGGVDTLKIHKLDAKGKEHGFGDWTVGKYVELFNHDDEGYGLFVIDEAAVIEADVATFKFTMLPMKANPQVLPGQRCLKCLQPTRPTMCARPATQ